MSPSSGKALAPWNWLSPFFAFLTPAPQASSRPARQPRHPTLTLPAQPHSFAFTRAIS